ncbi:hypothetical protein D9Q98_000966 [Chlorella vulgaris]|uniref:Spindle and kinetochore-associated protein 3 n=1 Tax=Chlorella vulgaris TaxID=3077 RepID=A0A9D4TZ88_CHLVU|nr:hypothetical protein D9Q98_000966 [Chlorella vulgaris]
MSSSSTSTRRALKGLEDGLQAFTTQLSHETAELRRNIDNQPTTGPTFYSRILADVFERLEGVGQELAVLEGVSLDAVSLEELVGHSVALYCQNHQQIQELEATLAQYGYRELYAPLPPETPLDMLELGQVAAAGSGGGRQDGGECSTTAQAAAFEGGEQQWGSGEAQSPHTTALGEATNRQAAAQSGAAGCEAPSPAPGQHAPWHHPHQRGTVAKAGGGVPLTTLKALGPMTAGRARLMRPDTPASSTASPEAMSPSMRELLGKYAGSSGGTHHAASASLTPQPRRHGSTARATPPAPSYLSPAFQMAAMDQEVQMAQAEGAATAAAAAAAAAAEGTPGAAGGWEADDAMYNALTATARKLAGAPSFMQAYRQRFPAIMASAERLLHTVEKQRRPAVADAAALPGDSEERDGRGEAAMAAADAERAAAGQEAAGSWRQFSAGQEVEEESTLDLMSQGWLRGRDVHQAVGDKLAEESDDTSAAAASAATVSTSYLQHATVAAPAAAWADTSFSPPPAAAATEATAAAAGLQSPPDTAPGHHLPSSSSRLQVGGGVQPVPARHEGQPAAQQAQHPAPFSERSKPQLEQAIAAALRRGTAAAAPTPSQQAPAGLQQSHSIAPTPAAAPTPSAPISVAAPAAAAPQLAAGAAQPQAPPTAPRPPPPPASSSAAASLAAAPAAPVAVPPLRPVCEEEYAQLPTFIRGQLPLDVLNASLAAVHAAAAVRSSGFTVEDVDAAGLGAKCKVVVNSLVKLGRAKLKVLPGSGTLYLLV